MADCGYTLESGSCSRQASRTASDTYKHHKNKPKSNYKLLSGIYNNNISFWIIFFYFNTEISIFYLAQELRLQKLFIKTTAIPLFKPKKLKSLNYKDTIIYNRLQTAL